MPTKYRATRALEIIMGSASLEIEADLEFTVAPYVPAQGPSYASGGQPAEGGHIEDIWIKAIKVKGYAPDFNASLPIWMDEWITANVDGDKLYQEAMEMDKGEREAAADDFYEQRRERRD
jgi:hypothetical protein